MWVRVPPESRRILQVYSSWKKCQSRLLCQAKPTLRGGFVHGKVSGHSAGACNAENIPRLSFFGVPFQLSSKTPATRMGFEPTRAEHNGLAVHRLNHSATSSCKQLERLPQHRPPKVQNCISAATSLPHPFTKKVRICKASNHLLFCLLAASAKCRLDA